MTSASRLPMVNGSGSRWSVTDEPKPKRRKDAKREPMPPELRALAEAAMEKHRRRFAPPALEIGGGWDRWFFDCPYRKEDSNLWQALLFEAFGTRSTSVATTFLRQLSGLIGSDWDADAQDWMPKLPELNTAIAIVASLKPENEAQACLAAQTVACHIAAMKLGDNIGRMSLPDERTVATMARAAKVSAGLQRTLAQLQGKLQPRQINQTIQVVYVDQRDQRQQTAVVGGEGISGGQGHEAKGNNGYSIDGTAVATGRPALPCPQSGGTALPFPSGEGQKGVPNAWWWQRLWRSVRRA